MFEIIQKLYVCDYCFDRFFSEKECKNHEENEKMFLEQAMSNNK